MMLLKKNWLERSSNPKSEEINVQFRVHSRKHYLLRTESDQRLKNYNIQFLYCYLKPIS